MNYTALAAHDTQEKIVVTMKERGFEVVLVPTKEAALEKIKELIPAGASVMNGSSRTLEQVGFVDYLKTGQHGWNNLHANILAEPDKTKQAQLRRQSVLSDYYLGSVHALAETGEMVIASNSGSQLPHIVFTSPNVILVVGVQKIVPTLADAIQRLDEYVMPLEDANMKAKFGIGTQQNKLLIYKRENSMSGRIVRVILVNESLGF